LIAWPFELITLEEFNPSFQYQDRKLRVIANVTLLHFYYIAVLDEETFHHIADRRFFIDHCFFSKNRGRFILS